MEANRGKIEYVLKPVVLGTDANELFVAKAALAAAMQGKFWQMSHLIWTGDSPLDAVTISRYAEEIGLDLETFKEDLEMKELDNAIKANTQQGISLGMESSPTLFINGQKYGNISYEALVTAFKSALSKAKK